MSNYIFGNDARSLLNDEPRYFYALRRTDDGDLFFTRVDQLKEGDLEINNPGDLSENYEKFKIGVDFLNGVGLNHEKIYKNLKYDQYRWDSSFLSYYLNDDGELVVRIGKKFDYLSNP